MRLRQLLPEDRPRERLLQEGSGGLSTPELLAVLLRTGTRDQDALQVGAALLETYGGLQGLARTPARELVRFAGLGPAKASVLHAALELARRLRREEGALGEDWRGRLQERALLLEGEEREWVGAFLLDPKGRVQDEPILSYGGLEGAYVDLRFLWRRAVRLDAARVVLWHNHPCGDPNPSEEDRRLTAYARECLRLLGMELEGHYVLARGEPFLLDEGRPVL